MESHAHVRLIRLPLNRFRSSGSHLGSSRTLVKECLLHLSGLNDTLYFVADVKLRLTLATVNPLALHYGLSGASLDKIRDGTGPDSPGYRLKKQGYERVLRLYEADPANFTMTYALARDMGNVQLVLLWDNVSGAVRLSIRARRSVLFSPCDF